MWAHKTLSKPNHSGSPLVSINHGWCQYRCPRSGIFLWSQSVPPFVFKCVQKALGEKKEGDKACNYYWRNQSKKSLEKLWMTILSLGTLAYLYKMSENVNDFFLLCFFGQNFVKRGKAFCTHFSIKDHHWASLTECREFMISFEQIRPGPWIKNK